MTDSRICFTCEQPLNLDDAMYFSPDRQMLEHLSCHALRSAIPAEVEASADPVYGPMS